MRCKESYITYYLIAAALLLNALERQKSQQSTCQLLYINYCIRSTFGTSPILSSIICVSTSVIAVSLLIDSCVLFIWYICDISVVFLCFFFVVGIGLLVDLFFVRHVYTFVNGLFNIFFACFLVGIFRDTYSLGWFGCCKVLPYGFAVVLCQLLHSFHAVIYDRSPSIYPLFQLLVRIFLSRVKRFIVYL